jgi:ribose transport system permease protein
MDHGRRFEESRLMSDEAAKAGDKNDALHTRPPGERQLLPPAALQSREIVAGLVTYWTVAALALVLVVFAFVSANFYTEANFEATSLYATGVLTIALGQSFAIISGGIDLSVGGVLAFSSMAAALAMRGLVNDGYDSSLAVFVGAAVGLLAGVAVGCANGLLITRLRLVPFIVTLGMLGVARGGANLLSNGQEVPEIPTQLVDGGAYNLFGFLPTLVAISVLLTIVSGVVLAKTRFGLRTYFIGSNREGARRAGVNVSAHLVAIYTISGFFSAVAGIMILSRFGIAQNNAGQGSEIDSIAAVVIGGASLFGGVGTIFGTFIGVCLISSLVTGLILANVQPFWQTVVTGLVIIGAVYIDQLRDRLRFGAER